MNMIKKDFLSLPHLKKVNDLVTDLEFNFSEVNHPVVD